jgi:hypothetical protein
MPCSHESSKKASRKAAAGKQQLLVYFCLSAAKNKFKNIAFSYFY